MPPWVERTRLYFSLDRFGVDGAAAVIESKLQELGLAPVVEGPQQRAQRLQRSLDFKAEKDAFERGQGPQAGSAAYLGVIPLQKNEVEQLPVSNAGLGQMKMAQHHTSRLSGLEPSLPFNSTNQNTTRPPNALLETPV